MIDFVCISPFSRIALRVAMASMHFYITQLLLFKKKKLFFFFRGSRVTMHRLEIVLKVQGRSN